MLKHVSLGLSFIFLLLQTTTVLGAQSTADVPVTKKMMIEAREKVLGPQARRLQEDSEYIVGQGDIISVQVYGEGDMAVTAPRAARNSEAEDGLRQGAGGVMVRIDGRISLQHIGDVDAVGYTLTQLADYLKNLYASVYDDPIVTVVLVQSNSQRYTVMGKVVRPGIYYIDYPINIVQAIARSGGFTEWAKSEITLIRKGSQKSKKTFQGNKLTFDYDDFLDGQKLEKNITLQAGDIIVIH